MVENLKQREAQQSEIKANYTATSYSTKSKTGLGKNKTYLPIATERSTDMRKEPTLKESSANMSTKFQIKTSFKTYKRMIAAQQPVVQELLLDKQAPNPIDCAFNLFRLRSKN